ncbi:hypothetical protein VTJ04DRAFT_3422 [Mycothermus thermophilus]|uniref:uncharacterized protein n=1 Tax=Humicola insolens TaxID=85995 RepID=UPI00374362C8
MMLSTSPLPTRQAAQISHAMPNMIDTMHKRNASQTSVCVCVVRVYVPKRGPMLSARISPKTPSHVCVHVMRQVKDTTKVNKNCDQPPLAVTRG